MTAICHGIINGAPVPFPLPNSNACVDSGLECPLAAGTTYTYIQSLPIKQEYPEVAFGTPSSVTISYAAQSDHSMATEGSERRRAHLLPHEGENRLVITAHFSLQTTPPFLKATNNFVNARACMVAVVNRIIMAFVSRRRRDCQSVIDYFIEPRPAIFPLFEGLFISRSPTKW